MSRFLTLAQAPNPTSLLGSTGLALLNNTDLALHNRTLLHPTFSPIQPCHFGRLVFPSWRWRNHCPRTCHSSNRFSKPCPASPTVRSSNPREIVCSKKPSHHCNHNLEQRGHQSVKCRNQGMCVCAGGEVPIHSGLVCLKAGPYALHHTHGTHFDLTERTPG